MNRSLELLRKLRGARRDASLRRAAYAQRRTADAQSVVAVAQGMVGEATAWLAAAQRPLRAADVYATRERATRVVQAGALAQRRSDALAAAVELERRCAADLRSKRDDLLAAQRALHRFDVWDELERDQRLAREQGVELEDEAEVGSATHRRANDPGRV